MRLFLVGSFPKDTIVLNCHGAGVLLVVLQKLQRTACSRHGVDSIVYNKLLLTCLLVYIALRLDLESVVILMQRKRVIRVFLKIVRFLHMAVIV